MSSKEYGMRRYHSLGSAVGYRKSKCRLVMLPLALLSFAPTFPAMAELYFNPRFLADDPASVADLSNFEKGQEVPEGTYRVDIYLNDGFVTTKDVRFLAGENGGNLVPCLSRSQLTAMGVNLPNTPASPLPEEACVPLTELIQDATTRFDVGQQHLYLSVPQASMRNQARGYIPPEQWDQGIPAALLNYNLTGNNVHNSYGGTSNYAYLNLQSGLNLGAWRLRDNTTWSYSSGQSSQNKWEHVNTYLERDIIPLRSRLTLGDGYTGGDIFDSMNFRGARIASDDNMLPDSQRGFAPVIHGIAKGTAQVSIKQNGYEIYQNTVPPGPFTISDLYSNGNSGDLHVSVKEADGSIQTFTVPYSSVPLLQREGHTTYAITGGKYRSGGNQQEKPSFLEATLLHGLPAGWTTYGGTQLAERYKAFNLGVGKNLGSLGAVSLDVTHADSKLPDNSEHQGQSIRFRYNKSLTDSGTNLQLMGYRYSTQGYYNFSDTTYSRMSGYSVVTQDGVIQIEPQYTDYYNLAYSKRGRMQVSVTQQLGNSSTLYVSGIHQTYWGTGKVDQQLQVGLNAAVEDINWTLSYSLSRNAWQDGKDQSLALSVSIPFSHWMRSDSSSVWRNANASYSMSHDLNGEMSNLAGVNGTLLADNNLSYSVQTGYTSGSTSGNGGTGYAAATYRGAYANSNVGYSHTRNSRQLYYGVSGGILAHENGVTFGQPMNDTIVLVKAPGAIDAKVENQTGVYTDWRGYAVLPYATDYRENRIALDTNTLANNVDLDDAVINLVPTHGAVVRADFRARVGVKVLMTLSYKGKPVPFGATVSSKDNQSGSIVADSGQVYLTGLPLAGQVVAKWGNGPDAQCKAEYQLPPESQQQAISEVTAVCR